MRRRYRQFITAALAILALTPALLKGQQSPRQLFERARIVEEANQDLMQAIRLYQQAAAESKDQSLSAQAVFRMADCYERLGNKVEARKTYDRVMREFAGQKDVATAAGRRLAAMSNPPADKPATTAVLTNQSVTRFTSVSSDGRWMRPMSSSSRR
jgi:tetratricopeptide (TPR) repeat protein